LIGTYALLFAGGFLLCGIAVIFLPLLVRFEFGAGKELSPPVWMKLRVWGLCILRFPGKRSARSSAVARWLIRGMDQVLSRPEDRSAPVPKEQTRRKSSRWGFGFLRWAALRMASLGSRLTRRLEVRCAGIDPALLGTLTGVAAIVRGIMGTRRFDWIPDFSPSGPRVEVRWDLSISIWKLVRWTGETFVDRNRRPERERDL
jgi:hypothetical protein